MEFEHFERKFEVSCSQTYVNMYPARISETIIPTPITIFAFVGVQIYVETVMSCACI